MAVFIIKAQYAHDDEEKDYENVYVGIDGAEAFSIDADDVTSLYMEIWVDNQIFSRQERFPNKEWKQTYNMLEELEIALSDKKRELKAIESRYNKVLNNAKSEGLHL